MGWLSKLIVVDNLGCPKCKRNSAEFLEKKNLPSNKEDMLESFNIDRVVQSDYYTTTTLPPNQTRHCPQCPKVER